MAAPTTIRRKPALDFSLTGLIFVAMMLFMGLAAVNSQANLLFGVFGLLIGILIVAWVISRVVLRKLDVRRVVPEFLVVGQTGSLQYQFQNRKRFWPSFSVTVSELDGADVFTRQPQAYLLHAAAKMTASVPLLIVPRRRGLHTLENYQLLTSFPFGFVKRAVTRQHKDTVVVYPAIGEVDRKLLELCLSAESSGSRMKPRRGGADEYYGVKEYRPGENPRLINWKRSARTGTLVSKEMSAVAPPRIVLMVDTWVGEESGRKAEACAEVEKAIAMAASLISRTIDLNVAVGLYVWADGWSYVPPSRGKRHSHELLALLARLPANAEHDCRELLDGSQRLIHHGTTPVLITPRAMEPSLAELARGNWVVVPVGSEQARAWFSFDPTVDFATCMPG